MRVYLLLSILSFCSEIYAQVNIPIGQWRTHLSYRNPHSIEILGPKVYAATRSAVFFYDQKQREIGKFTRIDGLSDRDISSLGTSAGSLLIGYKNGNVDIITDNEISNLAIIKNSSLQGSKQVNSFLSSSHGIFIFTGTGVVLLDNNLNVRETYLNLGKNGEAIGIYEGRIFNDSLFLATTQGIIAGSLDPGVNLKDFMNWRRYTIDDGLPETIITELAKTESKLFAGINGDALYEYNGNGWTKNANLQGQQYTDLSYSNELLLVSTPQGLWGSDGANFNQIDDPLIMNPQMAKFDGDALWIASTIQGLVSDHDGSYSSIFPNGPFSSQASYIHYTEMKILVTPGGFQQNRSPQNNEAGFYIFNEGDWINFNSLDPVKSITIPPIKDLTRAAYSGSLNSYFIGSFGGGVLHWDVGENSFEIIDDTTPQSLLENLNPPNDEVFITSIAASTDGLWICNYGADKPFKFVSDDFQWSEYEFSSGPASQYPLDITIGPNGVKWVILDPIEGGGILVFNENTNRHRRLTTLAGQGSLPSNDVNDIEIDRNGTAWVATTSGIIFFPFAGNILQDENAEGLIPVFESRLLFNNENVHNIEIDGGNRKWMTTSSGLWLFNETAEELISHFTTDNSPLLSHQILDLEIHPESGELFILTDEGIISYRGTATEGTPLHDTEVKIFPNPVTRNFSGHVGISGLAENAIVKITDVAGNLVWQTRSNGGTATWDVYDVNGNRPDTGVYLVFSATSDGVDTYIGKIAVIN